MWNIYLKVVVIALLGISGINGIYRAGQLRGGKKIVVKDWKGSLGAGLALLVLALLLVI